MGFFWTIVTLSSRWAHLALPRLVHGRRLRGRVHFLGFLERPIYRLLGTGPEQEQTWKRYAGAMVIFSASRWGSPT
jgi:K+-transporting ATPase A subunit